MRRTMTARITGLVLTRRLYRGLYILNWIYRYFTEPHYIQWIGEAGQEKFIIQYQQNVPQLGCLRSVALRHRPDRLVPRLFLLLHQELEEQ